LPLGQIVRDNNQLYIVAQRSVDMLIANGNTYFNVVYTLSRNRIARSENIQADSAVINYQIPDSNLVNRSQLYKDNIELSVSSNNTETPYLPMSKALVISNTLAGTNFDFTILAKNDYGSTPTVMRYVQNPTIFDLAKAKLFNANWQDNNILGFRLDSTGSTYVQTPVSYTDNLGKATNFELLVLDSNDLTGAVQDYNSPTLIDPIVPFKDITQVPTSFYTDDVLADGRYSIRIQEPEYDKDPFETPVFEYMIQGNDDYDSKGNIVIGNQLFTTFTSGSIRYHYIVSNTRFTAENENKQWLDNVPSTTTTNRMIPNRVAPVAFVMTLYSTLISTTPPVSLNGTALQGKHIGIYAVALDGSRKFLFAINDYNMVSNNTITVFINNWKI
jgi:hypothetical protein